jgi:Flp pilus assembly protein TadD
VLTYWAQHQAEAVRSLDVVPFGTRVANAIWAYGTYTWKAIWPANLAVFYPYPRTFVAWQIVAVALALVSISWLAVRQVRRAPYCLVGWLWFLGMLVPVIGLVQVGEQSLADRYTYLPLIGLFIALTWTLADLIAAHPRARMPAAIATAAGIVAFALVARTQAATWLTNERLWQHAVDVTADNYLAESALGDALADRGEIAAAIAHHRAALRIKPDHADAHNDLGRVLAESGHLDDAVHEFSEAVRLRPAWAEAHHNLGTAFVTQNRTTEAIDQFQQALRLDPDLDRTHRALGIQLQKMNRDAEALEEFRQVVRLTPLDPAAHFNLALMYLRMHNASEATKALTRVLELDPTNAGARQLLADIRRSGTGG